MRNNKRKLAEIIAIFFLIIVMYPGVAVKAEILGDLNNLKNGFNKTIVYTETNKNGYYLVDLKNMPSFYCKKFKASTTDKTVATVKYSKSEDSFLIYPQKSGTANITFSAVRNNKKLTCKGKIKVVKFTNPFKNLKINGKNYSERVKNAYNNITIKNKASRAVINYKLASDWKVTNTNMRIVTGNDSSIDIKFKKGKVYSMQKGNLFLDLILKNKKDGTEIKTSLFINQ